ncbi:MAG: hypothetical protein HC814_06355, partial [Rhodobacteraceae bacterium]|nr:hypothetical protein [Paracoccaceae bacterium]
MALATRAAASGARHPAASTQLSWSHAWPSPFDPFETLSVADWGDIDFDFGHPEKVPGQIEARSRMCWGRGRRRSASAATTSPPIRACARTRRT